MEARQFEPTLGESSETNHASHHWIPHTNRLNFSLCSYRMGTGPSSSVIMKIKQEELCVSRKASSRPLTSHSLSQQSAYFLWCCFCRAASDNCPWRISFLCLSISPSIRAKAWEPMKERSTPKPSSSSSSWLSARKVPSAESYGSRQQNWRALQEECCEATKQSQRTSNPGFRSWFWKDNANPKSWHNKIKVTNLFPKPISWAGTKCVRRVSIQGVYDLIEVKVDRSFLQDRFRRAPIRTYSLPITFNLCEYKTWRNNML